MDPVINLIAARTSQPPPDRLAKPVTATPFYEIGEEGFLLRTPGGGRLHYALETGLSLAAPSGRSDDDLDPFVETSIFGAAAWMAGQVPLGATALQLDDQRLLLIAGGGDERGEELTAALADALGARVASGPVVMMTDGPARACTSGAGLALKTESINLLKGVISATAGAPLRPGAQRLRIDMPPIDGHAVHPCAALICVKSVITGARRLETLTALTAIPEIRKHIFLPMVGKAIWGREIIAAALMVVSNLMPVLRLSVPKAEAPDREMVDWLLSQQDSWSAE